jgi:hypothetical protein
VDTHSTTSKSPAKRSPRGRAGVEKATLNSRYRHAEERIKRIVDAWPPLSDEQREKLALILCPGGTRRSGSDSDAA